MRLRLPPQILPAFAYYARVALARARARPFLTACLLFLITLGWSYIWMYHIQRDYWIRWYWNYLVSFHPALAYILPAGPWGPPENRPRWVEEIYRAPWMGTWDIPHLTSPRYANLLRHSNGSLHNHTHHVDHQAESERVLVSPAIVKIHVFSTTSKESLAKRNLIRSISPLNNLPPEYRHLVELKFLYGSVLDEHGQPDKEFEAASDAEQRIHGDVLRIRDLKHGENLREGKILQWIQMVGMGSDSEREAWYLFKMDDDTVIDLPNFLDVLVSLDPHQASYLGHSLNRWPFYHYHLTGMLTGFSLGLVKTLAAGIDKMSRDDLTFPWDDDVLTGELMFTLPSAPYCAKFNALGDASTIPPYCDPQTPPPWGYLPPPPNPDPRTGLVWIDFLRRMGDPGLWWMKCDLATHPSKDLEEYLRTYRRWVGDKIWKPPAWLEPVADKGENRG